MWQYFDKDFFKFLLGFVAIIIISLVGMALARNYQTDHTVQPNTITATPQS